MTTTPARYATREAEEALLGRVLMDPRGGSEAVDLLEPTHFQTLPGRRVFEAVAAAVAAGQEPDEVTVLARLREAGAEEDVGGLGYLAHLLDATAVGGTVQGHAETLRRARQRRTLTAALHAAQEDLASGEDVGDTIGRLDRRLLDATDQDRAASSTPAETAAAALATVDEAIRTGGVSRGLSWGIPELDNLAVLAPGDLTVLGARPSMGKTALALGAAIHAAADAPVLVVSLEMPAESLALRAMAGHTNLSLHACLGGRLTPGQRAELDTAAAWYASLRLTVADTPSATVGEIRAAARRMRRAGGLALVVVDYLQLLQGTGEETRTLEIAAMSRGLKRLAMELRVPVLALSQLSRALESRADKRPILADLRDSGAVEQDADVVVFIHRPEMYMDPATVREKELVGFTELIVAKHRNGPTGSVAATFQADTTRFTSRRRRWGA